MAVPNPAKTQAPSPRDRLRSELEAARDEYHRVLAQTGDAQGGMPSGNPKWTVGGVMAHIVPGLETVPLRLRAARRGRPLRRMPRVAFDVVNTALTRRLGRRHDRATIGRAFDARHAAVLALLAGVDDREWGLVSHVYIQRLTVEEVFAYQGAHIRGHLAEVRAGLGG